MRVFIPGNVPSSKNSKIKTAKGIFHSKTVRRYLQKIGVKKYSLREKSAENYKTRPNLFEEAVAPMRSYLKNKQPPHLIGFHFVRGTRHQFDISNVFQIITDLLVAHHVINDDSSEYLIPIPIQINGSWYAYNKDSPGVWLVVLTEQNIQGLQYAE